MTTAAPGNRLTRNLATAYRMRWPILFVSVMAHAIGTFHRASLATIADRIMADYGVTATALGGLGAAYFYIYAGMQVPSGALSDTLGPRKTITAGMLLSSVGTLVMGLAPSFALLYLGRLLVSFGVSVLWLSAIRLIMVWFHSRELGTITGAASSLVNVGQVAASTPLAVMVVWVGWQASFVTIGLVGLAMAGVNWWIVRDSPAAAGLPPLTESEGGPTHAAPAPESPAGPGLAARFRIVLANRSVWPLVLLGMGTLGAFSTLFHNWVVLYAMQTYRVTRSSAANLALLAIVGLAISSPVAGFLSDRVWRRRRLPAVVFGSLALVCYFLLAFWNGGRPPLAALYLLCFLAGFGTGSMIIIFPSIRETVEPYARGVASGLVNAGTFVGAAIAQPLFGRLLDLGWGGETAGGARVYPMEAFQHGLLLVLALAVLGFIGALLVKETCCRETFRGES